MAAEKRKKYMADFETTTDEKDCRVWASCMVDIDSGDISFIGNDIESFFKFLETKNSIVYFHNLKFDGNFLLSYLMLKGYTYSYKPMNKTFSCLITDDGLFYSITVIFEVLNKKYKKVVFYDSLKKLPFKVSVIAKAFELKDQKLEIDYKETREVGHVLTEQERQYIINDCKIVAQALNVQFSKGLDKMTNASDAMNSYKKIIGKERFEKWFPVLPYELDNEIRRAYKGGFTYLKPEYQNRRVRGGITLDVNSLYPWAMRSHECVLPYGYPMFYEGKYEYDEDYPIYIVHMKCTFELKHKHIPCLQLKNTGRFVETEYLTTSRVTIKGKEINEPVELFLTSVDYQLFIDHYDIDNEEYINGFKFRGATGMFDDYIDYWMDIKETSTGALRQLAKLQLNSLYGRFAQRTKSFKKACALDPDGVVHFVTIDTEKKAEEYGEEPPKLREPVYTALACFVTAYCRDKTIRSAQSVYDRFHYADTDSLHLSGTTIPEGLDIHPTRLGSWKYEGLYLDSLYIRAKTYMETMYIEKDDTLKNYARQLSKSFEVYRENGLIHWLETKVTCAGMPDNVKESVTYENFHSGSTFDGKLMPKRVKGGVVLIDTTFTIK